MKKSIKSMMIFAAVGLLVVSCAYAFEYRRYAVRIEPATSDLPGYIGVLERIKGSEDGSEDLSLGDCLARNDEGTPCIVVPRGEMRRIQEEFISLKSDNERLKRRCR